MAKINRASVRRLRNMFIAKVSLRMIALVPPENKLA
jgi:hypothetical protein